jgi:two-component system, OmpR family, manganese sensing sensor histidine kinase
MFHRSRRRLAYWFTLSMGSILILFAFTIYYLQIKDRMRAFDESLYMKVKRINNKTQYQLERGHWQINTDNISLQTNTVVPSEIETKIAYIRWYDARKKLVQFIGTVAPKKLTSQLNYQTYKSENCSLRQLTLPVRQDNVLVGYLQVAADLSPIQQDLAQTQLFLSLGVPLTLGLTGVVGWLLGGVAMKPTKLAYEQLQRFTADASHELRTPVAAILSNAQVGLLAPVDDRQEQRQRLDNIVKSTKAMSALINNLLFLARHEGRLNQKDIKSIELVSLLQSLVSEYKNLAQKLNLSFTYSFPSEAIRLNADPELLTLAVKNLLDNACKYTVSGDKIELSATIKTRRVFIEVKDSGIGIPAEDLPHIFDRFYRVDVARSRQTGGFGLGLAIARQIIVAHGGQITVASTVGQGTKFQICLPSL